MKPAFKTTALAILVALGVTACGGGGSKGGNAQEVAPTPVNPQTPAPAPAPAPTPTETPVPTPTPEQPSVGYQYNDNLKNKDGKEWRLVDTAIPTQGILDWEGYVHNVNPVDPIGYHQANMKLNFNQLSGNQLGKFSGTTEGDFLFGSSSVPSNKLDYTFINQPYSTYGVLTDEHGEVETFAIIQRSAKSTNFDDPYGVLASSERAEYAASPKGSATYTGNVFAKIAYDGNYKGVAKEDGTFSVTADFDNSTVSGKLNSDTVGEVKLVQAKFGEDFSTKHNEPAYIGTRKGEYKVTFGGKELNDVAGRVAFERVNHYEDRKIQIDGVDRQVTGYEAAFGGTKQ